MRKVSAILILILFSLQYNYSAQISFQLSKDQTISESIEFYTLDYPFFDLKTIIGEIQKPGDSILLSPEETSCVYFDFGPWQCYFFVEKDRDYRIKLPDISAIGDDWKRNPFFKKEKIHIELLTQISDSENMDVNESIRDFDKEFKPFIDKQILRYYKPDLAKQKRDSFIRVNYKTKKVSDSAYYREYIQCKKAILEFSSSDHDLNSLINEYLKTKKVNFKNPAYRELFELLLQDYFNFIYQLEGFQNLLPSMHKNSSSALLEILEKDDLMKNDTILEYLVYNEIYKAYYSGLYNKSKLLDLLESFRAHKKNKDSEKLAEHIKKKFLNMEPGYPVPAFSKVSIQGDTININSLTDKYVYLGFIDLNGFTSLQEIEYLKYLHSRHQKYIHIICFTITDDKNDLIEYTEYNSIQWPLIPLEKNDSILLSYQVRAMPIFYLIDKNGKLLFNPAAAPSENFELQLFELLKYRKEIIP